MAVSRMGAAWRAASHAVARPLRMSTAAAIASKHVLGAPASALPSMFVESAHPITVPAAYCNFTSIGLPAPVVAPIGDVMIMDALASIDGEAEGEPLIRITMNRNAREGKKPNHGKRPCSNRRRKRKARVRSNDHPFLSIKKKKGYDI